MTRDDYVSAIKSAFVTIGGKAVDAALLAAAPAVIANPIAKYLIDHIVAWLLTTLADAEEMQAFFIYIDVRTSKQGQEFFAAAKENRDVKRNPNATPEEKANAEKALIDKFRAFAKLTN